MSVADQLLFWINKGEEALNDELAAIFTEKVELSPLESQPNQEKEDEE